MSDTCQNVLGTLGPVTELSWATYARAFLFTCLLEAPVYAAALWLYREKAWASFRQEAGRLLLAVLVVNLCTHPLVAFGIPEMVAAGGGPYGVAVACGEIFAPVAEGLLLRSVFGWPWRRALVGALAANLWSWTMGAAFFS